MDYVRPIVDGLSYSKSGINCFSHPVYSLLRSVGPYTPVYFYTLFYLYSHYDLLRTVDNDHRVIYQPYDFDTIERCVLDRLLGAPLVSVDAESPLSACVTSILRERGCVIVPVDRRRLFYDAKCYMRESVPHLILLREVDSERRIAEVLDNLQLEGLLQCAFEPYGVATDSAADSSVSYCSMEMIVGNPFVSFWLPFDVLEAAHQSFRNNFPKLSARMRCLSQVSVTAEVSACEVVSLVQESLNEWTERRSELLRRKFEYLESEDSGHWPVIAYLNSQEVFVCGVVWLCRLCGVERAVWLAVEWAGADACRSWKKLATVLALDRLRPRRNRVVICRARAEVERAETVFIDSILEVRDVGRKEAE